jgi:hypothetical protein
MHLLFQCFTIVALFLLSGASVPTIAQTSASPSQGQFALKLVQQLGLGDIRNEKEAVELLSSLSIHPILPSSRDWKIQEPADEKFVASIQASMQTLLKRVATSLGINPPPTLELFIFEVPPAPQHVYFPQEPSVTEFQTGADGAPPGPAFPYEPSGPLTDHSLAEAPRLGLVRPPNSSSRAVDAFVPEDPDVKQIISDLKSRLANGDRPAVIVTLRQPQDLPPGLDRVRLINDVVDTLSDSEFELKRKYESGPGFSGFLLSDSALDKLQSDGRVRRIQVDAVEAPH